MSEQSETSRPADQPQVRPDTVMAPVSQANLETHISYTSRLAKAGIGGRLDIPDDYLTKYGLDAWDEWGLAEAKRVRNERTKAGKSTHLSDLIIKYHADVLENHRAPDLDKLFTDEEENFYVWNGWKAYLRKYGEHGSYSLEEIAATEKLFPSAIKAVIEDGTVKDPQAIRLYAQAELDYTRKSWQTWVEHYSSDPASDPDLEWTKQNAAREIAEAEREYLPLIKGDEKAMLDFCHQEAEHHLNTIDYLDRYRGQLKDERSWGTREDHYAAASSWFELDAQIMLPPTAQTEQPEKEQKQPPLLPDDEEDQPAVGKRAAQSFQPIPSSGENHLAETKTDFAPLDYDTLLTAIINGEITDPQAIRVLLQKELDWEIAIAQYMQEKYGGDTTMDMRIARLKEDYKPLLNGTERDLAIYCAEQASRHRRAQRPQAAVSMYTMANRLALLAREKEVAKSKPAGATPTAEKAT